MHQKSGGKKRKLTKTRQKLVLENQALVYSIVNQLLPKDRVARNKNWDDAVQAGMLGLTNAAIHFNPKLGNKFCTYAFWAIKREVLCWLSDCNVIHIPYHKDGHRLKEQFTRQREAAGSVHSIYDSKFSDGEMKDWIVERSPQPEYNDNHDELCQQVKQLAPRHREVVQYRFWNGLSYKEIGQKLHVSTERARQVADAAIKILRRRLPHLEKHF